MIKPGYYLPTITAVRKAQAAKAAAGICAECDKPINTERSRTRCTYHLNKAKQRYHTKD